jgi:hypothetical protein
MRLKTKLFNLNQLLRQGLNQPPALCYAMKENQPFCEGCEPGQVFECDRCHRLLPWCRGASDDFDEICDRCWGDLSRVAQQITSEIEAIAGEVTP